jgi:hypothetical protein
MPRAVCAIALAGLALAGCGGAHVERTKGPSNDVLLAAELAIVAEGPCAKLAVEAVGERRFLVYGDTGYELSDWSAGEKLAAAQSLIEITPQGPLRNHAMLEGLPRNGRGYLPADIEIGADSTGTPWLASIDARYAPRGTGALFERTMKAYSFSEQGWRPAPGDVPLDMGSGKLADVSAADACEQPGLRFVALTHAFGADGSLIIAGRCQDESHINYADTTLVVAHAAKGAPEWSYARLPKTSRLDGIVNVAASAVNARDAWLTAFEPYAPTDGRPAYLAHFDGTQWKEVETGIDDGLMSVAGTTDGALYLAGGRALYRRSADGAVARVTLPPLRYARGGPELHVHRVRVFPAGDVWVEAGYRVRRPTGEGGEPSDVWASALFSNRVLPLPLYCDAREEAFAAIMEIEGVAP